MDKNQIKFIYNEIWTLTFGAAFQRAKVYTTEVTDDEKKNFKNGLKKYIESDVLPTYNLSEGVEVETHIKHIEKISDYSTRFSPILNGGRLNFGVSQKLLNLLLKYLWCLFDYPEPPHFPLDRRIQESLNEISKKRGLETIPIISWTRMTKSKDYLRLVDYVKDNFLEEGQSLAKFELLHFERRRNQ